MYSFILYKAASILLHSISEIKYNDFLSALGPASDADRVTLFLVKNTPKNSFSFPIIGLWVANKRSQIEFDKKGHDYFVKNIWNQWQPLLSNDKPVSAIIGDYLLEDRKYWNQYKIKAVLALPIIIDYKLEAFISFDNCTDRRQWTRSEIEFLNTAANNLAIAIKRIEIKNELKKAHSELEIRVEQRTAALQQLNAELLKTIEERDRIQSILRETEKLAAIGKMTAQVVHEINNPLAGIKNSLLLVKEAANKNHKYYEYIERIEKEIDRVSNILKQMFDLYRPDISAAKEFHLYNTIFDVSELLKDAVNQKNIEIEIECSRKISIKISEDLLRQVIFNLIRNAINASGHNSKIKVNATLADGFLKLSVTDNGPGIDDKIKDKIFDPFFTTGMGGSDSGLGLGLAITKDIITAMRGQINFENINPKGAKFYISIPLNNGSLLK
jgi:signal transduction histidine kinase